MHNDRFEIDYSEDCNMISLNDKDEQVIIVLSLEQLEELIDWYCFGFNRILI